MKTFLIASIKPCDIPSLKRLIDEISTTETDAIKCDVPNEYTSVVRQYCNNKGLELIGTFYEGMSDAFDRVSIPLNLSSDSRILRECGRLGLPLLMSWNAKSIDPLDMLDEASATDVSVMYSSGNSQPEQSFLLEVRSLTDTCLSRDCGVGYIDDVDDVFTPALAVSLGASFIEKPFKDLPSFKQQIKVLLETEKRLTYSTDEPKNNRVICASIDLEDGEILTELNTYTQINSIGVDASRYGELVTLGARVIGKVAANQPIEEIYYRMQQNEQTRILQ